MKVPISGKVKPKNRENVERMAKKLERSLSETLDRILDKYFSFELEKNKETA